MMQRAVWTKRVIVALLVAAACACAMPARAQTPTFDNHGAAPEFVGIETWLNSDALTMQALRGRVVLIDFWTYSCINCLRTLPYVTAWYEKFKDRGFVIVGVHTPEFGFERSTRNVQTALRRFGIKYPVAQDNQYSTWKAYDNQYWPAAYLVDRRGQIRLRHFGEGFYKEMEAGIEALLAEESAQERVRPSTDLP